MSFTPADAAFETRVRASFASQQALTTLAADMGSVAPGEVEIVLPFSTAITQQHGFVHGGMLATAMDSACGYAALTTMPPDAGILTIEFKVNLLAPAKGERFRFEGNVIKPGRTITVVDGTAYAISDGNTKRIATMTAVHGRDDIKV